MPLLASWNSFYVVVGSAAGALIGLQFVVLTLIADRPNITHSAEAGAAFATPTVIHFGAALLLSALVLVPWQSIIALGIVWGIMGFGGVAYQIKVTRHIWTQGAYQPELEDWLFYCFLPLAAYATLAVSAFAVQSHIRGALFGVAAAALVLLFVGIHNAWDSVSYHVFKLSAGGQPNRGTTPAEEAKQGFLGDERES
jgi:hypothetical protein